MSLTLEQLHALKDALGSVGLKAGSRLRVDVHKMEVFVTHVREFIEHAKGLVKTDYSVVLVPDRSGTVKLLPAHALAGVSSGVNRFKVDFDFRLTAQESSSLNEVDTSERSEIESSLEIVVASGGVTRAFLCGRTVGVWETQDKAPRRQPQHWRRPMVNFDRILDDHIQSEVVAERGFRYWADRRARTLLVGSDGTERIFQHRLFWWLDNFVSDAMDVKAESRGMGQDSTDVTVVTPLGSHVIEVKWLGRNEHSTEFKHPPRIDEGLEQVSQYLKRDARLAMGHLVVYDARPRDDHEMKSLHDEKFRHPKCLQPHLVFLDSAVPSELAKRVVEAATGKTREAAAKKNKRSANPRRTEKKTGSRRKTARVRRGKKGGKP